MKMKSLLIVMALTLFGASGIRAQEYGQKYLTKAVLAGNQTDLSHLFTIQAPTLAASLTWILPSTNGTNSYPLTTDGSGNLSWSLLSLTTAVSGTLPVGNGGTGVVTLPAHGVVLGNGTSPVNVTGAGTSGQVLTSNGASLDPTWQAAGGAFTPYFRFATIFDNPTTARYSTTLSGTGSSAPTSNGLTLETGTTLASVASTKVQMTYSSTSLWATPQEFSSSFLLGASPNTLHFETFIGIGNINPGSSGTALNLTAAHIGFKIVGTGGTTANLYATQSDGTTEAASSSLTTLTLLDVVDVCYRANGTSSVDYYWRKNGGSWSSATNLTTNFPSGSSGFGIQGIVTNDNTASDFVIEIFGASFEHR